MSGRQKGDPSDAAARRASTDGNSADGKSAGGDRTDGNRSDGNRSGANGTEAERKLDTQNLDTGNKVQKKKPADVGRALRTIYDDTVREPIPGDFLDLLGKLN